MTPITAEAVMDAAARLSCAPRITVRLAPAHPGAGRREPGPQGAIAPCSCLPGHARSLGAVSPTSG